MVRKSKKILEEKKAVAQRLQELQRLEEEAKAEEQRIIDDARNKIEEICNKAGLFCGAILTSKDLGSVVTMAAGSPDKQTHIPFNLYFKESE